MLVRLQQTNRDRSGRRTLRARRANDAPRAAVVETLEPRQLLSGIMALRWEDANGHVLTEDETRVEGQTLYIAADTAGLRGKTATVTLVEDDVFFGSSYSFIRTFAVAIPADSDTGRLAWTTVWTQDFGGLTADPEYRLVRNPDTSDPVRSAEVIVVKATAPPRDTAPPRATNVSWTWPKSGDTSFSFSEKFADDVSVSGASFSDGDVRVTGPNGYNQLASYLGRTPASGDAPEIIGSYRVPAPGGTWDQSDNGIYHIAVEPNQVSDTAGNYDGGGEYLDVTIHVLPTASISGTVFDDINLDGVQAKAVSAKRGRAASAGEPGLENVRVFLDTNSNGLLDPGEPSTVTGADGSYKFGSLFAGTYLVRQTLPVGYRSTTPAGESVRIVKLSAGEESSAIDFANALGVLGVDMSFAGGDVPQQTFTNMVKDGIGYMVAGIWGGYNFKNPNPPKPNPSLNPGVNTQLRNAQAAQMQTAVYSFLRFDEIRGEKRLPTAAAEIDLAVNDIDPTVRARLKFFAIDVERDPLTPAPADQAAHVAYIKQAVDRVRYYGLKPIIYTTPGLWKSITGNSTAFSTRGPYHLLLWDTRPITRASQAAAAGNLSAYSALYYKPYGGWTQVSAIQYAQSPLNNAKQFYFKSMPIPVGTEVDLNVFDASLFD